MAGVLDMKRKIRSVTSMQQITKAMKMVAASRLRRAQEAMTASRPYAEQLREVLVRLLQVQPEGVENELLAKRPVRKRALILLTADRGLCGGFNANVIRKASEVIQEEDGVETTIITVGRRGRDFFARQEADIAAEFVGLGDNPSFYQAREIAEAAVTLYRSGEVDEVCLVYMRFVTVLTQVPETVRILPIEPDADSSQTGEYIFEPNPEEMLESLLPKYVNTLVYSAFLESKAGEHGARMTAMDSATENAKEIIAKYTLAMNRARQAAITTEISEIVGGAAALE